MFNIDGKEFRNLEEQVQKNKEDIARHYATDRALANFGIKIVGTVSSVDDLPNPETYTGEYGDGYAVGQPGNYVYYIFTRPDLNAGEPSNYWLDVGSISVVGPQGPQGIQGEQGPQGESNRWWVGEFKPTSNSNLKAGDLYLSPTGEVFQYNGEIWTLITKLQGPQGIQGPQGDVGGFINIAGIISSTNQLPTPASLQNLTIAYLVGETMPYELYIQVGENSSTAVWNNVGPFNAATLVSSQGVYQNVWNADTKLDKTTESGYRLYVSKAGVQGTVAYGDSAVANTIPIRSNNTRNFKIGPPINDEECANKKYVDDLLAWTTVETDFDIEDNAYVLYIPLTAKEIYFSGEINLDGEGSFYTINQTIYSLNNLPSQIMFFLVSYNNASYEIGFAELGVDTEEGAIYIRVEDYVFDEFKLNYR